MELSEGYTFSNTCILSFAWYLMLHTSNLFNNFNNGWVRLDACMSLFIFMEIFYEA